MLFQAHSICFEFFYKNIWKTGITHGNNSGYFIRGLWDEAVAFVAAGISQTASAAHWFSHSYSADSEKGIED